MSEDWANHRLTRPIDEAVDHLLGPGGAPITLVEYGSYACPHCRHANDRIAEVRDELGDRLRYAFRHRPLTNNDLARRAAELVERAPDGETFWKAHVTLMTRSPALTEDDLCAVAADLGVVLDPGSLAQGTPESKARVDADVSSANSSGVFMTPTFFINGRRYDGPWDESSFLDAMLQPLGHRVRTAALDFVSWGPSAGLLLVIATVLALAITNSAAGVSFDHLWHEPFGFALGSFQYSMSLRHWINDALLTIFFVVVGLEIKREFTVGHLKTLRSATLPIAAAVGGMLVPALIYLSVVSRPDWSHGWGIPMATDTAFAIALVVMLGRRVPLELRIFLTATAIVDDIGAILDVAVFYTNSVNVLYLIASVGVTILLALLNKSRVYTVTPYLLLGVVLWTFVHAAGLHATLAGVVLALFIPTRRPPDLTALMTQANTIISAEASHDGEALRNGPSAQALRALDNIYERIESPADRLLRSSAARSSYIVLPLFALANAGVVLDREAIKGHGELMLGIILALVLGKPLGILIAAAAAVWSGLAVKPHEYTWRHIAGAGALAGVGFTMSLFIAGQAFANETDFAAAKIAILAASSLSALIGVALLWTAAEPVQQPLSDAELADLKRSAC